MRIKYVKPISRGVAISAVCEHCGHTQVMKLPRIQDVTFFCEICDLFYNAYSDELRKIMRRHEASVAIENMLGEI